MLEGCADAEASLLLAFMLDYVVLYCGNVDGGGGACDDGLMISCVFTQ